MARTGAHTPPPLPHHGVVRPDLSAADQADENRKRVAAWEWLKRFLHRAKQHDAQQKVNHPIRRMLKWGAGILAFPAFIVTGFGTFKAFKQAETWSKDKRTRRDTKAVGKALGEIMRGADTINDTELEGKAPNAGGSRAPTVDGRDLATATPPALTREASDSARKVTGESPAPADNGTSIEL